MLNRDICFKCYSDCFSSLCTEMEISRGFEKKWVKGYVSCVGGSKYSGYSGKTQKESDPPKGCPHTFEHAVVRGMTNVE